MTKLKTDGFSHCTICSRQLKEERWLMSNTEEEVMGLICEVCHECLTGEK